MQLVDYLFDLLPVKPDPCGAFLQFERAQHGWQTGGNVIKDTCFATAGAFGCFQVLPALVLLID